MSCRVCTLSRCATVAKRAAAASLMFFSDLDAEEWAGRVRAAGRSFTARAILYIVAGHQSHHEGELAARCLVE